MYTVRIRSTRFRCRVDNYADESDGGDLGSSPYSPHLKLTNSAVRTENTERPLHYIEARRQ